MVCLVIPSVKHGCGYQIQCGYLCFQWGLPENMLPEKYSVPLGTYIVLYN